ncbi:MULTISPECIES: hypothetical protein [unclassified Microbacterium]|uniref:hypothetical protein n=1 Tax=unclassified Microbacterium TaxID=2609290 RepID=UPI00301720B1
MVINTQYLATVKQYQTAIAEAVRWTHPDYTASGISRERAKRVEAARAKLRAAVPAKPDRKGGDPRGAVVSALAPCTADQVAVTAHAWQKVAARLDAGQSLHTLVTTADRATLAAILDGLPTRPEVLEQQDGGAAIVAEVQALAFDRLVELGDEAAVSAQAQTAILDQADAWSDYLAALAEPGEPSLAVVSALHRADPEGLAATRPESPVDAADTAEQVRGLDHLVAVGGIALNG